MADRFYTDIEIPELPTGAPQTPGPGFLSVYARDGKLVTKNAAGGEVVHDGGGGGVQTQLNVDGGMAATTFQNYLLRLDFGSGGANINPTGTP